MRYRTFSVSYHKDTKFTLILTENSVVREAVADILDTVLCRWLFNHRFYWQVRLCNALMNWAWRGEKRLLSIPITKEYAMALRFSDDDWSWLDED
jgi:hypothetical protein